MSPELTAVCAFPWDFADKGLDATLARCRDLGVGHLFLAVSYHAGYFFYPDNPGRRVHLLEDGVTYFRPRPEYYRDTPLQPLAASLCDSVDWVEEIAGRLDRFGLKLGAWTVCLHNTRLGLLHPDCVVENALGDRYPHALCPSNPRVQAYVRGLARDLTDRFPIDVLLLEAMDYRGRRHGGDWVSGHHHERDGIVLAPLELALLDVSFSISDLAAATAEGIDGAAVRSAVRGHLTEVLTAFPERPANRPATLAAFEAQVPALADYRACLARQAQRLVGLVKTDVGPAGVRLAGSPGGHYDWLLAGAYGQPPSGVAEVARAARAATRPGQKVLVGIRLGFNPPSVAGVHSQAQLEQSVVALGAAGADGVMFYNLAETPARVLNWIPSALRGATRVETSPGLRVGLVGCGGIAEAYLRAARRVGEVRIVAVADVDLAQARRRADEFGIEIALPGAAELLRSEDLDAVVVAVPPRWHAEVFRECLAAGKHVLVEKPLGLDLAEAEAMVAWAEASDRVVGIGLVHRYLPCYRVARDLIRAGALGHVRQIRLRTGRDIYGDPRFTEPATTRGGWLTRHEVAGGGILMSSAIHLLSVGSFVLDDPPFHEVEAAVRQLHPRAYPAIEDDVTLRVGTAAGTELLIEDSWVRDWPFELEILGDAGRLRASGPSWATNVCLEGRLTGPVPSAYTALADPDGFVVNAAHYADRCPPLFDGLLIDFAAAVGTPEPAPDLPGAPHARDMQAAVTAAYEAAERRSVVAIPRWT